MPEIKIWRYLAFTQANISLQWSRVVGLLLIKHNKIVIYRYPSKGYLIATLGTKVDHNRLQNRLSLVAQLPND